MQRAESREKNIGVDVKSQPAVIREARRRKHDAVGIRKQQIPNGTSFCQNSIVTSATQLISATHLILFLKLTYTPYDKV